VLFPQQVLLHRRLNFFLIANLALLLARNFYLLELLRQQLHLMLYQ
jgi:hypothetical protein